MPLLNKSLYTPKSYPFLNGHLQTLIPGVLRKVEGVVYERERLELSDDDFVDLDWVFRKKKSLAVLSHGLEGDSQRQYILSAAKFFAQKDWDVLAWNCRSCSGEMNRQLRLYNHGEIEDLREVLQHAMQKYDYEQVVLLGYSMGGSINLKYASVYADDLAAPISHVLAFSSPLDLKESIKAVIAKGNYLYRNFFRKQLTHKVRLKAKQFPNQLDVNNFSKVKTWWDFDKYFSAPMNGFEDVEAFYHQASAKNFVPKIKTPSLLVNAYNDPIIPSTCSPIELAKHNDYFYLEMPEEGGHVGFTLPDKGEEFSWMEYRAWEFIGG